MTENQHFIIPDAQIMPGDDTEFVEWIGQYIVHSMLKHPERNYTTIQLGDWWDMHSLSWYDRGKKSGEGSRVKADEEAGIAAFERLDEPLQVANSKRRKKLRPRQVAKRGNHEFRATRYANDHPEIDKVGMQYLTVPDGWDVDEDDDESYNKVTLIDGVAYAHYFYNPDTGKPYGGKSMDARLKTIGHSFTMGHQQGLLSGVRPTVFGMHRGLVAGSVYPRQPRYLGSQTINHWRGMLVCHDVKDGNYALTEVTLDFLAHRFGGYVDLAHYRKEKGI